MWRGFPNTCVNLDRLQVQFTQKGGDIAFQPITLTAAEALAEWLRVRPRVPNSQALFVPLPVRGRAPRLTPRSAERILHHYLELADITRAVAFHGLRHATGQKLADEETPTHDIQGFLRHRHPTTTRIYVERSATRLRTVARHRLAFPKPTHRPAKSVPQRG